MSTETVLWLTLIIVTTYAVWCTIAFMVALRVIHDAGKGIEKKVIEKISQIMGGRGRG